MHYCCKKCNKLWSHPVEKCIFCGSVVEKMEECNNYEVIGFSEVQVPSTGNEKTPYFIYMLKDMNGNKILKKSFHQYNIGDLFEVETEESRDFNIGVIGTGSLGSQIAEYMLLHGYPTVVKTRSESNIAAIRKRIEKRLAKKLSEKELNVFLKNLLITADYSKLNNCDLIIEAAVEDLETKKEIFRNLSEACNESTIFATNTSSLSIDELAKVTDRPDKFIGMHFFNPVHKMELIEVVVGENTSVATKDFIVQFSTGLDKKPIVVKNSPGFIVNRYLLPQINEAIRMLEAGISSKEDIDSAIKLGLNHPMGPLELADFIGLDVCQSILEVLAEGFGSDRLKPAELLCKKVSEGKLGYKSGEGFYSWT